MKAKDIIKWGERENDMLSYEITLSKSFSPRIVGVPKLQLRLRQFAVERCHCTVEQGFFFQVT